MKSLIVLTQTALSIAVVAAIVAGSTFAAAKPSDLADFNQALKLGAKDQTKPAHKIIDRLLAAKATDVPRDRLLMTKGRLLFQDGDVQGSLTYYNQIPADSDYWLESLEEKSWAHLRMGEHGPALAQIKTLKAPMFQPLIGPEPYFLTGLIHLKVCDYPAIFESIKDFKEKYRPRLVAMQEISKNGSSEAVNKVIAKLRTQPLEWKTVAPEASKLPRIFHRDTMFITRAAELKSGGDASGALRRLKQLADRDLKEISDILQKMHLLEAEVIQRIHLAQKPNGRKNKMEKPKDGEYLVFDDDGEFWLDELDNYHVKVQGCPELPLAGGPKL